VKKRIIFIFLVIGECAIACWLCYAIIRAWNQKTNVLGTNNVIHLKKENYLSAQNIDNLSHYYEPTPNTIHRYSESWFPKNTSATINADGLNSERDYSVVKSNRTYRIIALGDSFTYGVGVNTKETWPARLEDVLNTNLHCSQFDQYEVLNLGVPGYDLQYEKTRFKQKGLKYNPDMVLWMVLENDFTEVYERMAERRITILKEFPANILEQPSGYGDVMTRIADEFRKTHNEAWFHAHYKDVFHDFFSSYHNLTVFLGVDRSTSYMNILHDAVIRNEGMFYYHDLEYVCGDGHNQFIDRHPNKLGHQKIAESVYQYIVTNNLIPCQ
jgi:lysophospholipase L1-like esterase